MRFTKALIKEYGEQVYRDFLYRNKQGTRKTRAKLSDAAWGSVYVAQGVGAINAKQVNDFHYAITNYAQETKFPNNFV